jgi:hypothetical protein
VHDDLTFLVDANPVKYSLVHKEFKCVGISTVDCLLRSWVELFLIFNLF